MATDVILPALGMSQDTGKIVQWLKAEGEHVVKGEPLAEIETDKATVEIDAPVDGVLAHVVAAAGDDVPVGQVIAHILAADEVSAGDEEHRDEQRTSQDFSVAMVGASFSSPGRPDAASSPVPAHPTPTTQGATQPVTVASPLASRIAAEHNLDLSLVRPSGRRIQKADVLTYLQNQETSTTTAPRLVMASPKARRLAAEQGKDLAMMKGSGPGGAVLAADVLAANAPIPHTPEETAVGAGFTRPSDEAADLSVSNTWRIMAERTIQTWTSVPHFYLAREVNASRLITWREQIMKRSPTKVTYTDLLVKIVAAALRIHPRLNASWSAGKITLKPEVHIGIAAAIEDGLVVPVIHQADSLSVTEIAQQRVELVAKAQAGKLRPEDIGGGTFTISNLGMYKVDAFNAIINHPQAAILAVGRITERVVPIHGQPAVQPMTVLTLSCDHRAVDGARGAQFLDSVATLIEEPLGLLV
jgi:pyruvate dehydrogenase E2 component (dihydrolipoamide acetyltransferase)